MEPMAVLTPLAGWIGRASLQGGVLVVLILGVQALLRERLAPRWRHALWLLLVARLALPWAPPSPLSLDNLIEPGRQRLAEAWTADSGATSDMRAVEAAVDGAERGTVKREGTPVPIGGVAPDHAKAERAALTGAPTDANPNAASKAESQAEALATKNAVAKNAASGRSGLPWAALWLAGAGACLGLTLLQTLRLNWLVSRCRAVTDQRAHELLEECQARMGLRAWLVIVEAPGITSPVLLGFIRPRLLLPEGAILSLTTERLRHVFLHELAHLKRRDIALAWVLAFLQALHWFNPLVWLAFARMRGDRELACDALVLSRLEAAEQPEYGRTILHMIERYSSNATRPGLAGILEGKAQIKRRITMIAKFRKYSRRWTVVAALVMLALGCVGLTGVKQPSPYSKKEFNRPFVNDPALLGRWDSVDLVDRIENFKPGQRSWRGELYLRTLTFKEGGKTTGPWIWTQDYLWQPKAKTEGKYVIQEINGEPYLFVPWINGDVIDRGRQPGYYVMVRGTGAAPASTFATEPRWDRKFENDPELLGRWETVDFVRNMADFKPETHIWQGKFLFNDLTFIKRGKTAQDRGKTPGIYEWTRGYTWVGGDRAEGRYFIKVIGGRTYLFMEFINGDVIYRGAKPWYYVLRKDGGQVMDTAQTSADQARLAASEAVLKHAKAGHEAGVIPAVEYWKADAEYKVLKAEQAGDAMAAALARVEYAEKILDLNRKKFSAGLAGRIDVLKAEAELKAAQVGVGGDPAAAARARLDYAKAALEVAKTRHHAGVGPYDEVLRAEAMIKEAEAEIARINNK